MSDINTTGGVDLLLAHVDDGSPVLEESITQGSPVDYANSNVVPKYLWDDGASSNDLETQGWGVIAPEGPIGDRLLGAIQRLVDRRAREQGRRVQIYRVPSTFDAAQTARWKKSIFDAPNVRRRDLPRFQLVLGDLDQVSLELQAVQASDGFVGRLAFDRLEEYEAYVDKLIQWEDNPAEVAHGRAVFHAARDGSRAVERAHAILMRPGLARARRHQTEGEFLASEVVELDCASTPGPEVLLEEASKAEPGVFFTIGHGAGAPSNGWISDEVQRRLQGALTFGKGAQMLTAASLRGRAFMPGGVWFMSACFGAGTPRSSMYERWFRQLHAAGRLKRDPNSVLRSLPTNGCAFTSALAKAALASTDGPLALIGHVDLAWSFGYLEIDTGTPTARPNRFTDVLHGVLRRDRVGVAFQTLYRAYGQINTEISTMVESQRDEPVRWAYLWLLRNDIAGYVLLGDPAARLPVRGLRPRLGNIGDPLELLGLR